MILIGQFDSPFVRRVAIALRLYGMPFEHRPWSTFGDAADIALYNPLSRVPTLVLDNGEALLESAAILDYLDDCADPAGRLIAAGGEERWRTLRICALASGLADKAVSLLYERVLRDTASTVWVERCHTQIAAVLDWLERDRAARPTAYWFRATISHADIAVACALRFLREAHADLFDAARFPALDAHAQQCEALPAFQAFVQPLKPPPAA